MSKVYAGIAALESLPPMDGTQFSPLEVPKILLESLGNPQNDVPIVHVAGTNGKGSVCTYLASIFYADGRSVGQFASPHLSHVTERCLINGVPVALADFDRSVTEVLAVAEAESLKPSYFVLGAIASFLEFKRQGLDIAVIEVGLGGLYDATNLIEAPLVTVVTSIGLDHTHLLGETIEEIAVNKAGIMKAGVPTIAGALPQKAKAVVRQQADSLSSPLYFLDEDYSLHSAALPLLGYQVVNASIAAKVAEVLGVSGAAIEKGIAAAKWPGRMEQIEYGGRQFLLDSAHNLDGIRELGEYLKTSSLERRPDSIRFLVSMLSRKNWREMLELLAAYAEELEKGSVPVYWSFCQQESGGAVTREDVERALLECEQGSALAQCLRSSGYFDSVEVALEVVREESAERDLIVGTGSIYFIGEFRPLVCVEGFRTFDERG